jgi:hypothetical protein
MQRGQKDENLKIQNLIMGDEQKGLTK